MLHLNNFLCHDSLTVNFKEGITLISGPSGKGKTTIIRAILWCLHGTMKNVSMIKKKSTYVKLAFQGITIERYTDPARLHVTIGSTQFNNEGAQSKINEIFGSEDLFCAMSVNKQKSFNILFNSTASSRNEIFDELIFKDEDPRDLISKIDIKIKQHLDAFNGYASSLNNSTGNYNIAISKYSPQNIINEDQVLSDIQSLTFLCQDTEQKEIENKKSQDMILLLNSKLQELHESPVQDNPYDIDKLKEEYIASETATKLRTEASNIKDVKIVGYTEQDYTDALTLEQSYNYFVNTFGVPTQELFDYASSLVNEKLIADHDRVEAEKLRVKNYERNANQKQIQVLEDEDRMKLQEITRLNSTLKSINQVKPVESPQDDIPERSYDGLQREKARMTAGVTINCISCGTSMKVNGKSTSGYNQARVDEIDKEISDIMIHNQKALEHNRRMRLLREEHQDYQRRFREYVTLEQQIAKLQEEYNQFLFVKNQKVVEARNRLETLSPVNTGPGISIERAKLSPGASSFRMSPISTMMGKRPTRHSLTYDKAKILLSMSSIPVPPKVSSKIIREDINSQVLMERKKFLFDQIKGYNGRELTSIAADMRAYDKIRDANIRITANNEFVVRTRNVIVSQLTYLKLHDIPEPSDSLRIKIQKAKETITESQQQRSYQKFINDYNSLKNHVDQYGKFVEKLKRQKVIAMESEAELLEEKVGLINETIKEIINRIFPGASLLVKVFKNVKTKGIAKPEVNLEGTYEGRVFNKLDQISGGQGDRTSLALTIGMSMFSVFPFVIFDETLNSLDDDSKINVIETLRECTGKSVIIIGHDTIAGFCDSHIEL